MRKTVLDLGSTSHYDMDLAPIFWPIEEATWLRCVTDSNNLINEILEFISFLQIEKQFDIKLSIIKDLAEFQVFVLSTMDQNDSEKKQVFEYNWKQFLVNNETSLSQLTCNKIEYSWKNKINEEKKDEWCYKAVWVGRNQGNYKCHLEFLSEGSSERKLV